MSVYIKLFGERTPAVDGMPVRFIGARGRCELSTVYQFDVRNSE